MISVNEVTIGGRCTWCKYFDPSGKPYTSMWIRIDVGNGQSVLVDIPINDKEMAGKALPAIRRVLEGDNPYVVIHGQIINKEDKKVGKTVTRIRANLRNVEALSREIGPVNTAIIAGDLDKKSARIVTVGVPYRNVKDNSWKKRNVPVLLPTQGMPEFDGLHRNALQEVQESKRVIVVGTVMPKLPNGDELVHVIATSIVPIQ